MNKIRKFGLALAFVASPLVAHSSAPWEEVCLQIKQVMQTIVKSTMDDFDKANTKEDKFLIATKPMNKDHILELARSKSDKITEKLFAGVSRHPLYVEIKAETKSNKEKPLSGQTINCPVEELPKIMDSLALAVDNKRELNINKTHPLALAIVLGDESAVTKFTTVIDDVNDPELAVWGYRQPYTLAHLVLDPAYPNCCYNDVPLSTRLAILIRFGQLGLNFNKIYDEGLIGVSTNPPLLLKEVSHRGDDRLQAYALFFGADPSQNGSTRYAYTHSQSGTQYLESILTTAFDDYVSLVKSGVATRPDDYVKGLLEQIKGNKIMELTRQLEAVKSISF